MRLISYVGRVTSWKELLKTLNMLPVLYIYIYAPAYTQIVMCPIKIFSRKTQHNTMAASAVPCLLSFLDKTQHVHEIIMLFTYVYTFAYDLLNQLTNLHKTWYKHCNIVQTQTLYFLYHRLLTNTYTPPYICHGTYTTLRLLGLHF